ncbi:MAG: hypothetical protein IJF16_07210 [Clostridia bacterium]|nr:hypothetical protein [Clostridia bacterium]
MGSFLFSKKDNAAISRRVARFRRAAMELCAQPYGELTLVQMLTGARQDAKKSFPAYLPCGDIDVSQAIDKMLRICKTETLASDELTIEAIAFYFEVASGRIAGIPRTMYPDVAARCYTERVTIDPSDPDLFSNLIKEEDEPDDQPWAQRGKFLAEELAQLCEKKPETIRFWRSEGRGGKKLMPETDENDRRLSTKLMFTPEAVNDFLSANEDLRTPKLMNALNLITKNSLPVILPTPTAPVFEVPAEKPRAIGVGLNPSFTGNGKSNALYRQFLLARLEENKQEQIWIEKELEKFSKE